jgi:hypothetical protein
MLEYFYFSDVTSCQDTKLLIATSNSSHLTCINKSSQHFIGKNGKFHQWCYLVIFSMSSWLKSVLNNRILMPPMAQHQFHQIAFFFSSLYAMLHRILLSIRGIVNLCKKKNCFNLMHLVLFFEGIYKQCLTIWKASFCWILSYN